MSQPSTLPLIDYVEMVWRRRVLVLVVVLVMTSAALAVSLIRTPIYSASAQVAVSQQQLDTNFNLQPQEVSARQLQTQAALVTGDTISRSAVGRGATSPVQTAASQQSNLITVTAQDSDPQAAARTANAYAEAYVQVTSDIQRQVLDDAANEMRNRIGVLQDQINPLLGGDVASTNSAVSALQQQQSTLQGQLGRLEVQKTVASGSATLVAQAPVPTAPVSPNPVRDSVFAMAVSLVLGGALAVVLEMWSRRKRDDVVAGPPVSPRPSPASRGLGDGTPFAAASPNSTGYHGTRTAPSDANVDVPTARLSLNGHSAERSGSR